jgi:hypothetical protein
VTATSSDASRKTLAFAAVVEIGTGLALLAVPALVIRLLMGDGASGLALPIARFLGIALLAFGVACWPGTRHVDRGSSPLAGMLIYNGLVAVFLAYLFVIAQIGGILLWPAVALHAAVAVLLALTARQTPSKQEQHR